MTISSQVKNGMYTVRAQAMRSFCALRSRSSDRTVIIFDPSLMAYHGHHAEFARILKGELATSCGVRFYAHRKATTRLLAELPAEPVCWDSIYVPHGDFRLTYCRVSNSLCASLQRIRAPDLGPTTIMLVHTLTVYQLGGLARWYASLPASSRPKLFIQFQFPIEFHVDAEHWNDAAAAAREAAETLAAAGTVRFASNSKTLAERIARQVGQPCAVMPLLLRWPQRAADAVFHSAPVFGFFGGLRMEKGAALMAEALPRFSARHSDTRFIVHAPRRESDRAAAASLERERQIDLISDNFRSKEDYFSAFRKAACILLPYDPTTYALRTSGIFIEAIGLGHLVITTKGTWMASELGKDSEAGFILPEFTTAALLEALERARRWLLERTFIAKPNRTIIEENSPAAFCAALLHLMET